jgi:hypothetical protein
MKTKNEDDCKDLKTVKTKCDAKSKVRQLNKNSRFLTFSGSLLVHFVL